jgi:hypothetical protein
MLKEQVMVKADGRSTTADRHMRFWANVAAVLVCGYGIFSRTFAYVGIPSMKVFIGDVTLALFIVCCTGAIVRPWLAGLLRPTPLSGVYWTLVVFISYGFLELARGLAGGYPPVTAMQDLVFNIYPLYFFVGWWAAVTYPDILPKIVKFLSVTSAVYGVLYYLLLRHVNLFLPGTNIPLIVTPSGAMAIVGLPCFVKDLRRWWPVLAISTFLVLGAQGRAEWLALAAVIGVRSILMGQLSRVAWSGVFVTVVLGVGFWADVKIPSPVGRGGAISSREIVARAVAAVDRDAAAEISREHAAFYAGTVSWRKRWWEAIWASVHADAETALLGHGYGYPIHNLVKYLRDAQHDIRAPHNVFYYTLGYTGWIGVAVFYSFLGALGLMLFHVWRVTGQPFGIVIWVGSIISGHFGNNFETPFGAIPLYLMCGMAAAELLNRAEWTQKYREWRPSAPGLRVIDAYAR